MIEFEKIERSSLGTPEAKAARQAADPAMVERVMKRVRAGRETTGVPCDGECDCWHPEGPLRAGWTATVVEDRISVLCSKCDAWWSAETSVSKPPEPDGYWQRNAEGTA